MRFSENRTIERRIEVLCCDRCGAKVAPLAGEDATGWFEARTWFVTDLEPEVVYHTCPSCRLSLGLWFAEGQAEAVPS